MKRWSSDQLYCFLVLMGTMRLVSCMPAPVGAQTRPPRSIVEAINDVEVDNGASYVAEIHFEKGKSALDSKDLKVLSDLIDRSLKVGDLRDLKVLGFPDQSFGDEFRRDFFTKKRKLATARNESIKKYIEVNYPQLKVSLYNMVTNPSAIEDLVKVSDANVRKTFEDAGLMVGNSLNACSPKIVSRALIVSIIKKTTN